MLSARFRKLQIIFRRIEYRSISLCHCALAQRPQTGPPYSEQKGEKPDMTTRSLRGLAPLRETAALALLGMLFMGSAFKANAEEFHNSLEGTWRLQVTVRNCQTGDPLRPTFPALFAFAKGGTATNTTAGQLPSLFTPGVGVWRRTEDHTYRAVFENFVFSPAGAWIQTHRFTHTIEIDNDADRFTGTIKLEIFDTNDNPIGTGCGTSVANRLKLSREDRSEQSQ
jgi:hypothetical protein